MVTNVDCWLCNLMHLSFWKFLFISLCVCVYIFIEHFAFILQMNNDDINEEFEELEAQDEEI